MKIGNIPMWTRALKKLMWLQAPRKKQNSTTCMRDLFVGRLIVWATRGFWRLLPILRLFTQGI